MNVLARVALQFVVLFAVLGLILLARFNTSTPFLWIFLLAFAWLVWVCASWKTEWIRMMALSLGFVFLPLAGIEWYLSRAGGGVYTLTYDKPGAMSESDPVRGYGPSASTVIRAKATYDGDTLYDVRYDINPERLRITPASPADPDLPCVLLFGGSYTFGQGLENDETVGQALAEQLDGRYRVYNFAFQGYGPHQMLAALQTGMARQATGCESAVGLYIAIASHPARAAGFSPWDVHGPYFEVQDDGSVQRAGNFSDRGGLGRFVVKQLNQSKIYATFFDRRLAKPVPDNAIVRFGGIVEAADQALRADFGGRLNVLVWDPAMHSGVVEEYARMRSQLRERGVPYAVLDKTVLPGDPTRYNVAAGIDNHPNAQAAELVGQRAVALMGLSSGPAFAAPLP